MVLVLGKIVTVLIPIFFKEATDALTTEVKDNGTAIAAGVAMWASAMVVAYGVGRIGMQVLNQVRDVLFTAVGQNAVRGLNNRTFRHLHRLSLRFHLERRTGGVSRVIERATRAIELIMRAGVLNLMPTLLEFVLMAGVLLYFFNWMYLAVIVGTVVGYMWFTLAATEWRITIRREMNDSDTETNTKAIDSLLNFETVKYFGNEDMEQRRFDQSAARYERAAIQTYYSLGVLNAGQAVIFTTGMTVCMVMAAYGVTTGAHTVGDFVMINALMVQLYIPLNFMGLRLSRDSPGPGRRRDDVQPPRRTGRDSRPPGCQAPRHRAGQDRVPKCRFSLRCRTADPEGPVVRGAGGRHAGDCRPLRRG